MNSTSMASFPGSLSAATRVPAFLDGRRRIWAPVVFFPRMMPRAGALARPAFVETTVAPSLSAASARREARRFWPPGTKPPLRA